MAPPIDSELMVVDGLQDVVDIVLIKPSSGRGTLQKWQLTNSLNGIRGVARRHLRRRSKVDYRG